MQTQGRDVFAYSHLYVSCTLRYSNLYTSVNIESAQVLWEIVQKTSKETGPRSYVYGYPLTYTYFVLVGDVSLSGQMS